MAGQDEVKGIDDHGIRKDRSVDIVLHGVKVILLRESISRSHVCSWGNCPNDVKVLEKEGPASLSLREFTRVLEIGQVFMVSENGDGVRSSMEILFPFCKSEDDSKEFLITDVIVAFGHGEGLGKVGTGVKVSHLI